MIIYYLYNVTNTQKLSTSYPKQRTSNLIRRISACSDYNALLQTAWLSQIDVTK